jgi:large subunit ribosomal protein L18
MTKKSKNEMRLRRHRRVRNKISGTAERPRMNIFRSLNHIYVQLIDDQAGRTIIAVSTLDEEVKPQLGGLKKTDQARVVGTAVAARAKEQGVNEVVFDRGGYKYHGRVQSLAEAAREAGLKF